MAIERIIGIDFGTSTSLIRVMRYEDGNPMGDKFNPMSVTFDSAVTVPTIAREKENGEGIPLSYGDEAVTRKRGYSIHENFKTDLESSKPEDRAKAQRLTEGFLGYMGKKYRHQSECGQLGDVSDEVHTIISYPVKWSEDTRKFMVEAAKKAGFPNVTGMDEAQAAIQAVTVMSEGYLLQKGLLKKDQAVTILLIDMGAGTTDLVLCSYTPGKKTEILSTWPKTGDILFGGREIDDKLQQFFKDHNVIQPEEILEKTLKRLGTSKFKAWKEKMVSPALESNDVVSEFAALEEEVERLSEYETVVVRDYKMHRSAFETCLGDYLKKFPQLVNGCLTDAKVDGNDVDLVILSGGHSQWYFAKEMLAGNMPQYGKLELTKIMSDPTRIIQIASPQETVARGLVYTPIQTSIPETSDFRSERKNRIPKAYLEKAVWEFFRDNPMYTCYDIPREMNQYIQHLENKDQVYYVSVTDRFNRHGVNLGLVGRVVSQLYGKDGKEFYMDCIDEFHNCVLIGNRGIGIKFDDENNYVSYLDLINVKLACANGYLFMKWESGRVLLIQINEVDNSPNRFIHVITELQRHLIKAAEQFNRVKPEK